MFGTDVAYTHVEDSSTDDLVGVFNLETVEFQGMHGASISQKPTLRVWLADLSKTPAEGDTLVINGSNYEMKHYEPDPHGGARLILENN